MATYNTTYTDLIKRKESGALNNSNYSPYRDLLDNGKEDGSTQYAPSSQYTPSATASTASVVSQATSPVSSNTNSSSQGGGSSFNQYDRNANPGEGYFWDAADGWKRSVDDARSEADALNERLRGEINARWDAYDNGLNNIAGRLPTQRDEQLGQLENLYGSSNQKLDTARDYANSQIDANQKTTLNELSDRLRAAMQAGNTYLGARGASNSSANERYSTALLKQANKQQGNVMSQSDAQRAQVQNTYDNNMAQLNEWLNTKKYEVGQWYNQQLNAIDQERANASGQRAADLANLTSQLYTVALQRLQALEDQANQYKQTVNAWMLEQQGNINTGINGIHETPMMPTYEDFSGINTTASTTPIISYGSTDKDDEAKAGQTSLSNIYSRYSSANPEKNVPLTF